MPYQLTKLELDLRTRNIIYACVLENRTYICFPRQGVYLRFRKQDSDLRTKTGSPSRAQDLNLFNTAGFTLA